MKALIIPCQWYGCCENQEHLTDAQPTFLSIFSSTRSEDYGFLLLVQCSADQPSPCDSAGSE